jgi:hypothetical protein
VAQRKTPAGHQCTWIVQHPHVRPSYAAVAKRPV